MLNSAAIEPKAPASYWIPTRNKAVRIAVWYAVLSAVWIVSSGWLLHYFVHDQAWLALLEDVKGWFFVLVTALLLGFVLDGYFKRAQFTVQRIQDSESKLHLVGDNLPNGYVYQYGHDAGGKPHFTYISAGVEKVHGVTVAAVQRDANCLLSLIDPEQLPAFAAAEQKSARDLTDFEMQLRLRPVNGAMRLIQIRSRPRRGAEGRVQWDGFVTDITELKSTETALRDSEAKWRSYIEYAPVGVVVADMNGRHVEANRCAEEMLGYEPGGLLGTSVTDLPAKENGTALQAHLDELAAKGRSTGQFWLRRKDGTLIWALVRAARLDGGRLLGVFQDITELKRAEEAVREREQQLQLFVKHSPAAIAMLDTNMRYLITSERWLSDYRIGEGSLVGRSHYEVFPDIPERWKEIHRRCLAGAIEKSDADAFPRADGSLDWVRWEIRPWRTGKGEIGGLIVFSEVITERRQAEEALRQSEANFRAMFEVASIGMAQTDPLSGQWLRVNGKMCTITGYSAEEMLKMKVSEITHPDDRERDWELFQRVIRAEVPSYHLEKRYLCKDGATAWVSVNMAVIRDSVGQPTRAMATIEDITERKRTEEILRLQSAALEATANAIVITDCRGKVEWSNRAFTTLTGYTKAEAVGKKPNLLKSGQHDTAFYRDLWQTILAGKVWHSEMINRHKDGHLYTEEATITPVPGDHGDVRHFIAVKQDITDRKRAELELEQAHNQLLSVSRQAAIAEFATGILHNVGNVLNSVGVASSCLAQSLKKSNAARLTQVVALMREHEADLGSFFANDPKGKLVPIYLSQLADKLVGEQATALQEIADLQKNVEHIKAIVTVQQDSAIGSNSSETLVFADLVEEALKMHANAMARSGILVIRNFDTLPPVMVQKHKILQILVNLIRNAIQACDASAAPSKEVRVCVSRSNDRLQCAIGDSGIGISEENIKRIFTFGFTTKKDGHGFGLSGAHRTARDMGGSLMAQSGGPGRGAIFTLELPLLLSSQTNSSA